MKFRNIIEEYRKKNMLTIKEFAAMIGCSTSEICALESGRHLPRKNIAEKIEKITGLDVKSWVLSNKYPEDK